MPYSFSIVTPSYNMLAYLKRCCLSVADQEGVRVEHLVIDGASTDGTQEWLAAQTHVHSLSEPDRGMYHAINKGLDRASGDIVAYLNCDEQYLPDTLRFVADYFERHPETDVLFGNALLIRPDGSLIAYRKAYPPRRAFILTSHLYVLTCTMFFRRRILDAGFRFDESFAASGDEEFVLRLLSAGFRMAVVRRYFSAFTMTGDNLGATAASTEETRRLLAEAPWWMRTFKYPLNVLRLLQKGLHGAYHQSFPLRYAVYTSADRAERSTLTAHAASFLWKES